MKRLAILSWGFVALLLQPAVAGAPTVRLVEFEAVVHPVSVLRITQAIDDAEEAGDEFVLIRLDTPGGLVASMETVVKRMLASRVPIVVWVGPSGAKAASAGLFILVAADLAAMAPATRTGASSTVIMGGENTDDNVLLRKANQDLAALIRSIAERRGRDVEACEAAVFEAKSFEETVALEKGLIDLIAPDLETLMERLHQREVRLFDGSTAVLETAGATFVVSEFPLRQEFMELLAQPAVAALLLLGGLLGLYVEFTHPGVVFPGVAGALCLLLFALSARVLPVSTIGVLLILLAMVMFALEVKVASYGMLTFGGVLALSIGAWMLVDGPIPELRVPMPVVLPASLTIGVFCAVAVRLAVRAQQERVGTGVEGLASEIGTVTRDLGPDGKIFVHGETWDATSEAGSVARGERVRVVRVDGMRLVVRALSGDRSPNS